MVSSYRNLQSRKNDTPVGAVVFWVIVAVFGVIAWLGYCTMILCGILWGEFQWLAPIGFWPATGLAFFGGIVMAALTKGSFSVSK